MTKKKNWSSCDRVFNVRRHKPNMTFSSKFCLTVTFDGTFFSFSDQTSHIRNLLWFGCRHPPRPPKLKTPKQGHKPLCNIYETALITDCFNLPPPSGRSDTVRYGAAHGGAECCPVSLIHSSVATGRAPCVTPAVFHFRPAPEVVCEGDSGGSLCVCACVHECVRASVDDTVFNRCICVLKCTVVSGTTQLASCFHSLSC